MRLSCCGRQQMFFDIFEKKKVVLLFQLFHVEINAVVLINE